LWHEGPLIAAGTIWRELRPVVQGAVAWGACTLSIAAFGALVVIPAARDPYTNGFATLYAESRILFEDPGELRRIYDDDWFQRRVDQAFGRHVAETAQGQPPTMSLILAAWAWLSPGGARIAWIVTSTLLWVAGLATLAGGLGLRPLRGVPPLIWLSAATTPFRPLAENLARGQGYAMMFFLLSLVVRSVLRSRDRRAWIAGIPLGLMLILKSAGLWLHPLFAVTGRWRLVAVGAATALAAVLLVSPLIGWRIWPFYLTHALRWVATEPSNHVSAYQTIQSLAGHLFVGDATWNPAPVADLPALAWALAAAVLALIFVISARVVRLDSESLEERALSIGLLVAPLVPVAPIGEGYHYLLLFPAILVGWWWAFRSPARAKNLLLVAVCTGLVCVPQRYYDATALQQGWATLLAYPRVYGAIALWGLLARALAASRSYASR